LSLEWAIALGVGVLAAAEDIWRRTISNWLVVAALAGGLISQLARQGAWGAVAALAGAASGFGVFLVFYWLGGMGGGDVKLMAGFGALLGAGGLIEAAFWTALLGGLLAAGVIALDAWRGGGRRRAPRAATVPYAPAIVAGVWVTMLSRAGSS